MAAELRKDETPGTIFLVLACFSNCFMKQQETLVEVTCEIENAKALNVATC